MILDASQGDLAQVLLDGVDISDRTLSVDDVSETEAGTA